MVSCQSRLPEQETEASNRHIPPEIAEQILLNLPIKSLLRFSCVAASWNSTITSPQFAAKHGGGRKMVMINDNPLFFDVRDAFCSPLSTITDRHVKKAKSPNLVCPFEADAKLEAFCDELCCVQVNKSLYLWNPSTGACKKLPDAPSIEMNMQWFIQPALNNKVVYGLGYDAVVDDYKLLKVWRSDDFCRENKLFIYSLKNDSWREIPGDFPGNFPSSNGLFVGGALNWMPISRLGVNGQYYECLETLVSFDFSTEEFRVFEHPPYLPQLNLRSDIVDVAVLSGKLCVYVNYLRSYWDSAFVLWAEDYGVVESWTKLFDISYKSMHPIVSEFRRGTRFTLRPLYLYEDGRVVILVCIDYEKWGVIAYEGSKVVAHSKIVPPRGNVVVPAASSPSSRNPRSRVCGGFVYVESVVSPANWNLQ